MKQVIQLAGRSQSYGGQQKYDAWKLREFFIENGAPPDKADHFVEIYMDLANGRSFDVERDQMLELFRQKGFSEGDANSAVEWMDHIAA